jgi:hypothetical protein
MFVLYCDIKENAGNLAPVMKLLETSTNLNNIRNALKKNSIEFMKIMNNVGELPADIMTEKPASDFETLKFVVVKDNTVVYDVPAKSYAGAAAGAVVSANTTATTSTAVTSAVSPNVVNVTNSAAISGKFVAGAPIVATTPVNKVTDIPATQTVKIVTAVASTSTDLIAKYKPVTVEVFNIYVNTIVYERSWALIYSNKKVISKLVGRFVIQQI